MPGAICGWPACRRTRRGPIRIGNVLVYDPSGRLLGKILLPERALNVGFGGADWKTLYITATTSVYRVKTRYGGIPHPTTRSQGPPAITATGIVNASARGAADLAGFDRGDLWKQSGDRKLHGRTTLADAAFLQPDAREHRWPGRRAALRLSDADQRADTVGSRSRPRPSPCSRGWRKAIRFRLRSRAETRADPGHE